ncbi:MAG TPA: hypothetical protein VKR24_07015 [Candidatus Limnocylindrales bacterium]|nr:hypothetical protein [Candidatus Limnocylindrales bacterium]
MEYRTVDFGGLSAAVCQVDSEPALFPPTCWTSSSPFWELFVARKGGGWTWSSLGMSAQVFHDGDAEGFRYEAQSDQLPPKILGSCPSATPTPNPTAKPTARPTPNPTARPTAAASAGPATVPPPTLNPGEASSAPAPSPSQPPLGDVAGATATAGSSSDAGPTGSPPPPGSNDGSPALPIAIAAIVGLAGLAVLRRRPNRSGRAR